MTRRFVAIAVASAALTACGTGSPTRSLEDVASAAPGDATTTTDATTNGAATGMTTASDLALDDAVAADLVFLREEEKLARDVYITLGERWGLLVFANISDSEQQHMDAVLGLLQAAGIPDPAAGAGVGEFTNPELGELYAELVDTGMASPVDALAVGATIEDLDLSDLSGMAGRTADPRVLTVYENLMKGSRNHLRSFVEHLAAAGVTYEPQFIDEATYEAIVTTPAEHGR
jgi:hypothetical protein